MGGGRGRGSRRRDGLSCPNLMVYKYLKYGPKTDRNDFKLLGMSTEFLGPLFFLIIISGDFVRVRSGGSRISQDGRGAPTPGGGANGIGLANPGSATAYSSFPKL